MSTYQIDAPIGAVYDRSGLIASRRTLGLHASRRVRQFVRPIVRLFEHALAGYRTRLAEREMEQLDDRMLRDIGISRETIKHVVRYGRERDITPFAAEWASWSNSSDPFYR